MNHLNFQKPLTDRLEDKKTEPNFPDFTQSDFTDVYQYDPSLSEKTVDVYDSSIVLNVIFVDQKKDAHFSSDKEEITVRVIVNKMDNDVVFKIELVSAFDIYFNFVAEFIQ